MFALYRSYTALYSVNLNSFVCLLQAEGYSMMRQWFEINRYDEDINHSIIRHHERKRGAGQERRCPPRSEQSKTPSDVQPELDVQ